MSKIKIQVFENPVSDKVIATFNSIKELLNANESANYMADQIAINDCVLYGWDELYDFV